eukprot:CAMPEP_0174760944 /NCGR_PEP_ID=MMETSP1094-20130205/109022_1 /TAXON_ID=156173 /ORGANISM="Chrysochromulina brevifilum, Strain UTEX LB 985" /LENGTH=93 /DNA_ID=CAMNT_0015966887 /DNA_START=1400 /DNA_END=1681 /DNA_ORIENTATION=+
MGSSDHGFFPCVSSEAGHRATPLEPRYFALAWVGVARALPPRILGCVQHGCHGGTSRVPGSCTEVSYPWLELVKAMGASHTRSMSAVWVAWQA